MESFIHNMIHESFAQNTLYMEDKVIESNQITGL